MVKRVYVEKKIGFDTEAKNIKKELRERFGITGLKSVRVVNRYDVENIKDVLFEKAKKIVFSVPATDMVIDEELGIADDVFAFGMEYLPGGFDQRQDTAETCIRLIDPASNPTVKCAKIIIIEARLKEEIKDKIIKYYINPTDARQVSFEKPKTLGSKAAEPLPIAVLEGFRDMDSAALRALEEERGFAMSHDDMLFVQKYFSEEEFRDPTDTEIRAIDTYWSDHCRHTTFLTHIPEISFGQGAFSKLIKEAFDEYKRLRTEVYGEKKAAVRPVTLMDMATIGAKYMKKQGQLDDLDESDEVNACCIKIDAEMIKAPGAAPVKEPWLVYFKNETHNHPTEIEPFGGASTCLGGGIRDPLSGRACVHQAMRITGCGNPHTTMKDTLPGKLTQYQITRTAAKGYSSYGNQIGGASGHIEEIYDDSYIAKRMELGALVAAAPASNVVREQPVSGDVILLIGGRTGRDGIGAATGSSKEQSAEALQTAGAEVQKGNPSIERNIVRLYRRPEATRLIKRCNDFGAGGVAVAIGELAESLDVNLDMVKPKYDGMDGTELALSESQERMAVVIAKDKAAEFLSYCAEEDIEAAEVAKVTDTGRFRIYWRGEPILDLSRKFLDTNGAVQKRKAEIREEDFSSWRGDAKADKALAAESALLTLFSDLNCASQRGLIENFDSTVGAGALLMPLGGKRQLTPAVGMAAKLPVLSGDTNTATLMAHGYDPKIAKSSSFHSAIYAVLDSCAKIAAMGGDAAKVRLSFQEFFPKPGSVPARWGSPAAALLGALKAQIALGVPSVGGKDSMSGSFRHIDVVPTLVSFAVCTADARHILSQEFKKPGSKLVLLEVPRDEELLPDFEAFKKNAKRVYELAKEGKILAANTIAHGGVFVSAAKMALGNGIGAELYGLSAEELTSEYYGALLLEIDEKQDPATLFAGLNFRIAGKTNNSEVLSIRKGAGLSLSEILERMEAPLAPIFPLAADASFRAEKAKKIQDYPQRCAVSSPYKTGAAKPKVFIPVFPGTNSEVETMRAFERAGADVTLINLIKSGEKELQDSIRRMAKETGKSQILVLAGGYSGGDEPEGSAKFMEAILRNPYMKEAVADLLEKRSGLMLGICTGFQALLKLGLLPYGKITENAAAEGAPVITANTLGRHTSRLVRSRVCSVLSPWLAGANVGDIHTLPISCGEGRFAAGAEEFASLAEKGQVAAQYVDFSDAPSYDLSFNPPGSMFAVEALTSPDGLVFGRMGHSERNAPGLYVNVSGCYDESIFASGVGYFK